MQCDRQKSVIVFVRVFFKSDSVFNPFLPNEPFLYPLETPEELKVF